MANVAITMDALKQATVNSLYNVICGCNVCKNMKYSYCTTSKDIRYNNNILCANYYTVGDSITMADLPYAISWLRNPQKVGLCDITNSYMLDNTNKLPNDLYALLWNGSYSQGNLTSYGKECLCIYPDKEGNFPTTYWIELCGAGYSRNSICKELGKLSLSQAAEAVQNDSKNANIITTVGNSGYNVKGQILCTCLPLSCFGDATAADVLSGKTFTSCAMVNATGTMPNQSDKLKTNYYRNSLDLNGYACGWLNAPPNIYNDGCSVFTGVNVKDITWIKDDSGKVCKWTRGDCTFYRGCYLGYEVLFDEPEYKDNNPSTGIKTTHNAARWINDLCIPEFGNVNPAGNFYYKGDGNMLPSYDNKSMTLLRSYFDIDTNSYSYIPIKVPLSAFTQRTYTDATEIAQCNIGGTYTLTPSTPSVTITPGYTGGGTVNVSTQTYVDLGWSDNNRVIELDDYTVGTTDNTPLIIYSDVRCVYTYFYPTKLDIIDIFNNEDITDINRESLYIYRDTNNCIIYGLIGRNCEHCNWAGSPVYADLGEESSAYYTFIGDINYLK